jgi:serine/threonine protein kinase
MAQPRNPDSGGSPSAADPRDHQSHRDTMLLSDVPDVASLVADASAASVASAVPAASTASDPPIGLSAAALASLGQRYDILGEAGHGSMGNVYKARDRETGETVALKLLKPEIASDQAMMDRFKNELLFARKITHKNVCRVHDFNRIGSVAYTTMEFVDGESLRSALNRFSGLPLRKGAQLAIQICSGLREAHAQGIVHRDLKPENVMIDVQGNVKIMDFGIARSMEGAARLTGSMIGTPAYMAPEQVAGKAVDYRTDIYSLGLILYEMFTGVPAFQAEAPVAVALKQMRESPRPPHEIDPAIPVPLERAILKCLEKDPARRFQSISELEAVLRSPAASIAAPAGSGPVPLPQPPSSPMLTPLPPRSYAPEPKPRRTPFVVWLLLAALMVLGALGAVQAMSIMKAAENIPAPSRPPDPSPPDFAFEKPVPEPDDSAAAPADAKPADAKPADTKPEAHAPAKSPAHAKPRSAPPNPDLSVALNSPSAKKPNAKPAPKPAQPAVRPNNSDEKETNATYLWVGRFDREEKAQDVARRIRDLGLPVVLLPRHTAGGDFYAVFTGPFGSNRVTSVMQWLATQGFRNVHQVANPGSGKNAKP